MGQNTSEKRYSYVDLLRGLAAVSRQLSAAGKPTFVQRIANVCFRPKADIGRVTANVDCRRFRLPYGTAMPILLVLALSAGAAGPPPSSSTEAKRTLRDYALCTAKHHRSLVSTAVVEDWSTAMMIKQQLITPDCLSEGTLTAYPLSMMRAFGEALAVTEKYEIPPAQVASAPALVSRQPDYPSKLTAKNMGKEVEEYRIYNMEQRLGECVIHQDASSARSLLNTRIGATEEQVAARKLIPALSRCVEAGVTVELTAEVIREAVALAYYRMEMAARGIVWRPDVAKK